MQRSCVCTNGVPKAATDLCFLCAPLTGWCRRCLCISCRCPLHVPLHPDPPPRPLAACPPVAPHLVRVGTHRRRRDPAPGARLLLTHPPPARMPCRHSPGDAGIRWPVHAFAYTPSACTHAVSALYADSTTTTYDNTTARCALGLGDCWLSSLPAGVSVAAVSLFQDVSAVPASLSPAVCVSVSGSVSLSPALWLCVTAPCLCPGYVQLSVRVPCWWRLSSASDMWAALRGCSTSRCGTSWRATMPLQLRLFLQQSSVASLQLY